MLQAALLVAFPALMIFSALSDLFTMTISNRVSLALVGIFVPFGLAIGLPPSDILLHLACGGAVLLLTFTFFALRWIGGGDAKLAAATAVWMGFANVADYGLDAALIGGALTLAILAGRHLPLPAWAVRIGWLSHLHDRTTGIPYGIALAVAGLVVYPDTGVWTAVALA